MERDENIVALFLCGQWDKPPPNGFEVNTVVKHEFCVVSVHVGSLGMLNAVLVRRCVTRLCIAFSGGDATNDQDTNNSVVDAETIGPFAHNSRARAYA